MAAFCEHTVEDEATSPAMMDSSPRPLRFAGKPPYGLGITTLLIETEGWRNSVVLAVSIRVA